MSQRLKKGSVLIVKDLPYEVKGVLFVTVDHYAVFDGEKFIQASRQDGMVSTISIAEFENRYLNHPQVKINYWLPKNSQHGELVVRRARSLLGKEYSLKNFNCENFARFCYEGKSESKQVNKRLKQALVIGAAVGIIGIILSGRDKRA